MVDVNSAREVLWREVETLRQRVKKLETKAKAHLANEAALRSIINTQTELICRFSPDTVLTFVNEAYCIYFDKTEAELLGHSFLPLLPEDAQVSVRLYIARLCAKPVLSHNRHPVLKPNGEIGWQEWVDIPLFDAAGNLTGFQAVGRDITEQQQAQNQYRLFFDAVRTSLDGINITDLRGNIVFMNRASQKIFGYEMHEMLGKHVSRFNAEPDISDNVIIPAIHQTGGWQGELLQRRKDGHAFPIYLATSIIKDESGQPLGMIGVMRDISRQKAAENQLLTYQEELRSLATRLSLVEEQERRRVASILHDNIGQALTFSIFELEKLMTEELPASIVTVPQKIHSLLSGALAQTRSLVFDLSPPVLYKLGFGAAIEWLGERIQKEHNIHFSIETKINEKQIAEDMRILLFQIVRELVFNIVKHAEATAVRINIYQISNMLEIVVADNGKGFTIAKNTALHSEDSGFGLFNIRERLRYHGGNFTLSSQPKKGTRATIKVPCTNQVQQNKKESP